MGGFSTVNSNQFISSLSDGSVKIVDCTENGTLTEVETFEVHRRAASTSLCAIGKLNIASFLSS